MLVFILLVIAIPFALGVIVAIPIAVIVAMAYWR